MPGGHTVHSELHIDDRKYTGDYESGILLINHGCYFDMRDDCKRIMEVKKEENEEIFIQLADIVQFIDDSIEHEVFTQCMDCYNEDDNYGTIKKINEKSFMFCYVNAGYKYFINTVSQLSCL